MIIAWIRTGNNERNKFSRFSENQNLSKSLERGRREMRNNKEGKE